MRALIKIMAAASVGLCLFLATVGAIHTAKADRTDPAPQTVMIWGGETSIGVVAYLVSESPGAPDINQATDLATADVLLRSAGFHLTHVSDNMLFREYQK